MIDRVGIEAVGAPVGQADLLAPPRVLTRPPRPSSRGLSRSTVTEDESTEGVRPSRIGDHPVLDVLGRGGMGVVYLAEDTRLKRRIAI